MRQLLVESGVVAALGGGSGLLLSVWAVRLLNGLSLTTGPTGAPIFFDLQVDSRVLLFTATVTIATTLLFGVYPAVQASRVDLVSALKDVPSRPGRTRSGLRGTLLVVQISLSFVLLVAALLTIRSVRNTRTLDIGFDPDGVVTTSFDLQRAGYDHARAAAFRGELLRRVRAAPGIERAAFGEFEPMGGRGHRVALTGPRTRSAASDPFQVGYNRVSDDYFTALGHAIVRGRAFTSQDRLGAPVVIVNETVARRFWPGEDAVGKWIRVDDGAVDREIVGVARNARYASFADEGSPFIFLPLEQHRSLVSLFVRSAASPADVAAVITRIMREIDPNVVPQTRALRETMAFALVPVRVGRLVFGIAGVIALLLATGGLYGLVCYTLEQRLREIGIRIALGATRRNVFHTIVGGTLRLTATGVVIGLALAAAATRLLTSLLYGVTPTDPRTFGGVAALLVSVTLAAGYAAARKGLAVDPMMVLRRE